MNTINREVHYCKACDSEFRIKVDKELTGDYFIVCPRCERRHYRYFYAGEAQHCDITKRKGPVKELLA